MIGDVLLVALAVLLVLLVVPIVLTFEVSDKKAATVRWLFLRFPLYPPAPAKPGKEQGKGQGGGRQKAEKPRERDDRPAIDRLTDFVNTAVDAACAAGRLLRCVRWGLLLWRLRVQVSVSGPDAAETAIGYGRMCAGIYTGYSVLAGLIRARGTQIHIVPDYSGSDTTFSIRGKLCLLPIAAVAGLVWGGAVFLKRTYQRKMRENKLEGGALK